MEIRIAEMADRAEIVELYQRSQAATQLPDPTLIPRDELGDRLYAREAIKRYVAVDAGRIVGHGLIEKPNQIHLPIWKQALDTDRESTFIEMGGAFVEPELLRRGIWSSLLLHRINVIRNIQAVPVTATWAQNDHVKRKFEKYGGTEAGIQSTPLGEVSLFVF